MIFQQAKRCNYNTESHALQSFSGPLPVQMSHSDGTALPLVVLEKTHFGADVVRFGAGESVGLHTHVGDHILMVTKGEGTLTYGEEKYHMFDGMIYLIPGNVPHAINAITELVLIAIGNDHRAADSYDRLDIIA